MEVILAQHAGFCFGVRRAVDKVYELSAAGGPIYTYGPIIHNEEVVKDLEKKGVQVIENEAQLSDDQGRNGGDPFSRRARTGMRPDRGEGAYLCGCHLSLRQEDP